MYSSEKIIQKFTKESKMEVWKEKILGFDSNGLFISNKGRVKTASGEIKNLYDNGGGYFNLGVYNRDNKKSYKFYIHRLVAELFIGETCDVKTQVNHIDGDKSNNHVDNLEWVCPKENIRHMHDNEMNMNRRNHGKTYKLSDSTIAYAYSKVVMGISGVGVTAKEYGMPRTTLSSIVNKRTRRDVTDSIDELLNY